jgi:hypothetical protein
MRFSPEQPASEGSISHLGPIFGKIGQQQVKTCSPDDIMNRIYGQAGREYSYNPKYGTGTEGIFEWEN